MMLQVVGTCYLHKRTHEYQSNIQISAEIFWDIHETSTSEIDHRKQAISTVQVQGNLGSQALAAADTAAVLAHAAVVLGSNLLAQDNLAVAAPVVEAVQVRQGVLDRLAVQEERYHSLLSSAPQ
jgi:hypothetical protein